MSDEKKEEIDLSVFDRAMETTHPIFHGWLKAAKEHGEGVKRFKEFLDERNKHDGSQS